MADDSLTPERFGSAFKGFMDAVVAAATPPTSPLIERMRGRRGADLTRRPVIAEEYATFDQPNLQVALDAYLAGPGRRADLVGVGPTTSASWRSASPTCSTVEGCPACPRSPRGRSTTSTSTSPATASSLASNSGSTSSTTATGA